MCLPQLLYVYGKYSLIVLKIYSSIIVVVYLKPHTVNTDTKISSIKSMNIG